MDSLKRIGEINLTKEHKDIQPIEKILLAQIKKSQLPEFFFKHMAGIVAEESPNTTVELFDLIGDFIMNGIKVSKQDSMDSCDNILKELKKANIIKEDNRFTNAAQRLEQAVKLQEVELIKEGEGTNYDETLRGKAELVDNEQVDTEAQKQKKKKQEKEEQKKKDLYDRYKKDMLKHQNKLPPIQVRHSRNEEGKSLDLVLNDISVIIGGRALLDNTNVKLSYGRKYGLIGRNGIGKTCFMNALARAEFEKTPKHLQILLVEQEIKGIEKSPLDYVLETDVERTELLKQEQVLIEDKKDPNAAIKLQEIYQRLEQIDSHTAEARASQILGGLGFSNEMMRRPTKSLSGGWRMRVTLARALFVQPDILLLDEPTNHLDLDAVMWLEDYIINCSITVVIVSHAREFLNVVCDEIIHFYDCQLTYYRGNYDSFEKTRSEKLKQQQIQRDAQQSKIAHMQSFIDKFRCNAKRAGLVQSRIKAINKMELVDDIVEDPSCVFIFPNPEKLRPPLMKIEDGNFGYKPEDPILKNINFHIDCESRIAVVGANGVGKSTLLKLLMGDSIELDTGNHYRNGRLRVSMFTQHHLDTLDLMLSPLEQLVKMFPGSSQETYRAHLGSFGITGNMALRPNYLLSGGQKSRVAFAVAVWNNPHILILDEPTNHLDIDAVNALIIALNNYQGGVLIVSHDQHLISTVCDSIYYIKEKRLKRFNGDFDDYKIALSSNKL